MRPAPIAAFVLFLGCSTSPGPMPQDHAWERVAITDEDRKSDPLKVVPALIEQRERPGSLDHAIALLRWHVQQQPQSPEIRTLLAEAHARSAEALDPRKSEEIPYHAYHWTEGIKEASEALRLAPDSGPAHYWLASNLLHAADAEQSLGRATQALKQLDDAERLSPEVDQGGPARLRGKVLHDMPPIVGGSVSKAVQSFHRSLKVAPGCLTTHLWLGEAYLSAKKNDLARKELEWVASAKVRPDHEREDGEAQQKAQELLRKIEAK